MGHRDISSKMQDESYLVPPTTKKEAQHLMGLFGFWKQSNPYLRCFTLAHLLSDSKSY